MEYDAVDISEIRQMVSHSTEISDFQRKVFLALLDIPMGQTVTYGELARRIGCNSAQAVGQALKRNLFAPMVPCHRVVAANGAIGGYMGKRDGVEIDKKRALLNREMEFAQKQVATL